MTDIEQLLQQAVSDLNLNHARASTPMMTFILVLEVWPYAFAGKRQYVFSELMPMADLWPRSKRRGGRCAAAAVEFQQLPVPTTIVYYVSATS